MCSHTFKSQNQLQMHISSAHPSQSKSLTCLVALCGKTYAQISHLNLHMKIDHKLSDLEIQEGLVFKCEYCGKSYTQNHNLKKHMKNVHQGQIVQEGEIFSCDQCEKVFGDEKALIIHGAKSHKVYFNCSMCSQNFIFENQLQMHISSSHPFTPGTVKNDSPTHPYKCDICVLSFKLKSELELHRMIHHEKSNFKCKYCEYTCTKNEEFRNHLKSHIKNSIMANKQKENVQKNVTTMPEPTPNVEPKKLIKSHLKIKAFARIKEPAMGEDEFQFDEKKK